MSWTGSENQRRPQGTCECPNEFRGSQRYVSESDCAKPSPSAPPPPPPNAVIPFGQYKGRALNVVPTNYLQWVLKEIDGYKALKKRIRRVLRNRRKGPGKRRRRQQTS